MSATAHHRGADRGGRPGWLLPAALVAAVVVVAGIVAGVVLSRHPSNDGAGAQPAATASTVLLPSPTPTVSPAARRATTAFAKALPTSVLQYALASSAADTAWQNAGALEAWEEKYTDGAGGTLTVRAGQWETADQAKAFAATLVKAVATPSSSSASASPTGPASTGAATLPRSGDVTAGGATVGSYTVVDSGDGTGTAVWTNGQSVLMLVAPVAEAYAAYTAFPL